MVTKVRTIDFLPDIFKTKTNNQFLSATLDQLVQQPDFKRIQGFIGSKFGYGVSSTDKYLVEPTKTRTNYQLEPAVVFKKKDTPTAVDVITYPEILDSLKLQNGYVDNDNNLFNNEFYSWDSYCDLDKLINFAQYYWLPNGPESLNITTSPILTNQTYTVDFGALGYSFTSNDITLAGLDPVVTLVRGGRYNFIVNQTNNFWIQTQLGTSGVDPARSNVSTREIFGIENNGTNSGTITFDVPLSDAQNDLLYQDTFKIDLLSTIKFDELNGALLSKIKSIDGITNLNNKTVLFYGHTPTDIGDVSKFYGDGYDINDPNLGPITKTINITSTTAGTNKLTTSTTEELSVNEGIVFNGNVFGGITTYRTIVVTGTSNSNNSLTVFSTQGIDINQEISFADSLGGIEANKKYYIESVINSTQFTVSETPGGSVVPVSTATGTTFGTFYGGVYYVKEILSSTEFTISQEPNGPIVELVTANSSSEGLMPATIDQGYFEEAVPTTINKHYYKINLLDTGSGDYVIRLLLAGSLPDNTNLNIQYGKEYIGKNFVKNSYAFISLVPEITAALDTLYYQDAVNPDLHGIIKLVDNPFNDFIDVENDILGKLSYISPNGITFTNGLKVLFTGNIFPSKYKSGEYYVENVGRGIQLLPVDSFEVPELYGANYTTPWEAVPWDAFAWGDSTSYPSSQDYIVIARNSNNRNAWSRTNRWFHADVLNTVIQFAPNSDISSAALGNAANRAKRPIIEFYPNIKLFNAGTKAKPNTSFINFTVTDAFTQVAGQPSFSPDGGSSYLYDGATIIFAGDEDLDVRNKIWAVSFDSITGSSTPVITLTVAPDGNVVENDQTIITQGETYIGKTYYFDGSNWIAAQQKERVNQPPKFDIFDSNGISYGDQDFYPSNDFTGCTLFEYAIGTGTDDPILKFPIKYSSTENLGDYQFNVPINTQTFNYVDNQVIINQPVSNGYVYNYTTVSDYDRLIGWQTTVENSFQYQVFDSTYAGTAAQPNVVCDVQVKEQYESAWPVIVVYKNNVRLSREEFTYAATSNTTTVIFNTRPIQGEKITIMLYSNQISKTGYYQIPSNLDHNPFNSEIDSINMGDIRGHYKSICNNVPSFQGYAFGPNNYRDLGNIVPYGTRIIQNSASIVNAAAFLRNQNSNFFDSLFYNANEYNKFKGLLIQTVVNNEYNLLQTPSYILDDVIDKLTSVKSKDGPFFWSDMVPSKNVLASNTYTFKSNLDTSVFNLTRVYDFTQANYYGLLVYLTRRINGSLETTQLIKDIDYTVSSTEKSLTITKDLFTNDVIVIKEYDQTYGSYVPNTPTKLGLYPSYIPQIVLDSTYLTPTYFVQGHDGSYNKLYGTYTNGILNDIRDRVLLEFETRIYNNLKISSALPVTYDEIVPGQFRNTNIKLEAYLNMYSTQFLNWVGINKIDYQSHTYQASNPYTFNYKGSKFNFNNTVITTGGWRGIYLWLYDTSNPDTAPWEILGLTKKPTWWDSRYGVAPYTSDNTFMWQDIANGYIWNDGNPYVNENRIRDGLLGIIPVDTNGALKDPFEFLIGSYNVELFSRKWITGDVGPAEYSYLKSSSWPFDLMRIMALMKPAKFFSLGIDVDKYKYNEEFKQYLYNNRTRDSISQLTVYGNGTPTHSYVNWMVDYLYQYGVDGTTTIDTLVKNLDVRLTYRLAGFSDKDLLNFFAEKGSENSHNNSLLIPDDSYAILLHDNQPNDTITYSSVIVQKVVDGYAVYGNSQNKNYFTILTPVNNGLYDTLVVENVKATVPKKYTENSLLVPYGNIFSTIDQLSAFLRGYGLYLNSQGVQFEETENGIPLTWDQMILEMLYWVQTGWDVGSTININPNARTLVIDNEKSIVQPLTVNKENFALNQNLLPIALSDMFVERLQTSFSAKVLNSGDSLSFFKANLSSIENVIVFDNVTIFNDVIYNLVTGLRQQRLYTVGQKTSEWNGYVNTAGFILNQDNIVEWIPNKKYTRGTIVKYKNDYYMAEDIVIIPKDKFDYTQWRKTSYTDIQKGLLPNPSTRAYESTLFYNTTNPNFENDNDLLSASLIGFRPRPYFADANLTDATQVNVYKNMIDIKGTVDSVTRLQGVNLQQNQLNYEIHENWAIKQSEYGGLLNQNYIEVTLDESQLTGNPSIVALIRNDDVADAEQQIPLYKIKNYGRPVSTTDILPTLSKTYTEKLASAGYVNMGDVRTYGYNIGALETTSIYDVYKNDYIWIADKDNTWQIYTPLSTKSILTTVYNNVNGTVTLTFDKPHGLLKNQVIGIINFDSRIEGYHLVDSVGSLNNVTIVLTLDPLVTTITGNGICYLMQSQRVVTARDMDGLPLLNAEYGVNKVWVDENVEGSWSVYEKTNNYSSTDLLKTFSTSNFGGAVDYVPDTGYFASDITTGTVYHYGRSPTGIFYIRNVITVGGTYGTTIIHCDDLIIISKPDDSLSQIFVYRLPPNGAINSIILEQTITIAGGRVGDAMDISGDGNLLYLGAQNDETVLAFQRDKVLTYESIGISLSVATSAGQKYFIVPNDRLSYISEGQRVNFVSSYDSLGVVTLGNASAGLYRFRVSGDQTGLLANGDKVAFDDTGPASTYLYTISNEAYDPLLNRTTFYTVEMIVNTIYAGSSVYKVQFSDNAVYTVITGTYDSIADRTTFYTLEEIEYTAASGSNVFFAKINFGLVGAISAPMAVEGDKFGFSVATNQDGSRLFVGAPYTDYSVSLLNTGVVYVYDRLIENVEVQYDQSPTNPLLIVLAFVPTNQTRIYVNGVLLDTSKYVVILNIIVIGTIGLFAGDIITISSAQFVLTQEVYGFDNLSDIRQGELFGYSLDTNKYGSELIVGSPFEVFNDNQTEGAVLRFTNEGKRFGTMTGLIATNLTAATYLLINGYRVTVTPGNAAHVANEINQASVTNIFAYSTEDGRLVIRLRDNALGPYSDKLTLGVFNGNYLYELGFTEYIKSQVIQDPHAQTNTQFGYKVKFNEDNSFVVSAPVSTRYINTSFDFSDDYNIHNDTVFDNNLTCFEDGNPYAGSVYMYDYIQSYDESLTNIGKYVYAQSLNDIAQEYGATPMYGKSVSFNNGVVMVGSPDFLPDTIEGKVLVWTNPSLETNWHTLRESNPIVDIEKIQKVALYDNNNNETLTGLDYIDPLQGKLLGVVAQNLDYITSIDPADYNAEGIYKGTIVWNKTKVGKIWFNTSSTKFINYHQNDSAYNSKYWGTTFPGSDVTVYTWIESDSVPAFYTGTGTPYDLAKYSTVLFLDSNNNLVPKYYYWVRNTNIVSSNIGKTLSDSIIEQYITDPKNSGISFFAPLSTNIYAFYNSQEYINDVSTNLHLGYGNGTNSSSGHLDFQLIRTEYPDDFLFGFPNRNKGYNDPIGLYDRYLDSFAGVDESGAPVPDYNLPKMLRTGIYVRPRQSFFNNRLLAIKNYLEYANAVVKTYPINEFGYVTFLYAQGTFYDTTKYWSNIYWWADGYSDSTRAALEVGMYSDLLTLSATEGLIVGVAQNGQGNREVYIYTLGEWVRIGVQNGTIEFSDKLWDYEKYATGFGVSFDSAEYDSYPSTETRYIIRALNEQIYTGPLFSHRNKSLTMMFEYIQSENLENQNYMPWLTKTSLADVGYTVRELTTNQKYQRDNESLLEGYINEVKPYHVIIKEFYLEYSRLDEYTSAITDYDLPSFWNDSIGRFVSPQLLYGSSDSITNPVYPSYPDEFTTNSTVWEDDRYSEWFNNFGMVIQSKPNTEMCVLGKYISNTDIEIYVDNAEGLPTRGIIRVEQELIGYTRIDRFRKLLTGVSRGVNNTTPVPHFATQPIYMDLPGIVVLDSGREYNEVPTVRAYVDTTKYPAPRTEAILKAVLADGKVVGVDVVDSGDGYVVEPEIVIDSSFSVTSELFRINFVGSTVQVLSTDFVNGEVVYSRGITSNGITIIPNGYYYIHTIQIVARSLATPANATIISFHKTYNDAILGKNNVRFISEYLIKADYQHEISIKARAIPSMVSSKVRSIIPTLKFDRTSYRTKVDPWTPNEYYSSPYLSLGNDASSPTKLYYAKPSAPLPCTGSPEGVGATFIIYNDLLGGTYDVEIYNPGDLYLLGDVLRVQGSSLGGYSATEILTATIYSGVSIVSMADTTGLTVGDYISGDGVQYGSTILSITSNVSIMMSLPATKSRSLQLMFLTGHIPNDALITVTDVNYTGVLEGVTVYGTGIDAGLSSLQGAVLPINSLTSIDGQAVINIDYSYSDLKPGQVNGSYMYFYRKHDSYTYDDTGTNFAASIVGNTMTVTAIQSGKTLNLNDVIYSPFVYPGTTITAFGTGSGGLGTYTISGIPQTVTDKQMNNSGGALIKISRPRFNFNSLNNSYYIQIYNPGLNYQVGDTITISGALLGGVDKVNDAKITVTRIGVDNSIFDSTISGTAVGEFARYYVKPIEYNETAQTGQLAIYEDSLLNIPVSYSSFMWNGTYGTDYGYLPEPIQSNYAYGYQISSLVSYAGYIWQCIEANNDSEFNPSKWYPLSSSDSALNALDRIEAYYVPTIDMPGKDAQQLVKGITYPNNVYYGNSFAPEDEYPLDTIVQSEPFYPTGVNVKSITNDGTRLVAVGDTDTNTIILLNESPGIWSTHQLSAIPLGATDITYSNGEYVITTSTSTTPLYVSWDGIDWTTSGKTIGWDEFDWDDNGWGTAQVTTPLAPMESVISVNNIFYSAGTKILRSVDGIVWNTVYQFPTYRLENTVNTIAYVTTQAFIGFIAVGTGYEVISGAGTSTPDISTVSRIVTSVDGITWALSTPNLSESGLNSVTASTSLNRVVVVGDSGKVWYSSNASNWVTGSITGSPVTTNINSVAYGNGLFIAVGNKTGTSSSDPALILTSTNGITWTQVSSSFITTENLVHIYFSEGAFYLVGDSNTILQTADGITYFNISTLQTNDPYYVVQGNDFLYGYGPEELVAGVVTDTLSMYINTAPGSYWDTNLVNPIYWYKHTGFNMVSFIANPNLDLQISFAHRCVNPAGMSVFIMNTITNTSYRIYENLGYTIDWINEIVTLLNPLTSNQQLMVEIYEVGNGVEIVRNNSKYIPTRTDPNTGFSYYLFENQYEPIVNDPLVYASVEGNPLTKLVYNTDYIITSTSENLMQLQFLNATYNPETDYVVFSILRNSDIGFNVSLTQYGYSIPETQVFLANTSTTDFELNLSLTTITGDNINNSIVEINGVRLIPYGLTGAEYSIVDVSGTKYLRLNSAVGTVTPDIVAITTYYDTSRQYLTTEKYTSTTGIKSTSITFVDNTVTPVLVTFASDPGFSTNDLIRIGNVNGSTQINGLNFYVSKVSATSYQLYLDSGLTNGLSGSSVSNYLGSGYAWLDADTIVVPDPSVDVLAPKMTYDLGNRTWVTSNGLRLNPTNMEFSVSASFTGSISGTTLTVTSIDKGVLNLGQEILGANVALGTTITKYISGLGGIGTYEVNTSQTMASASLTTEYDNRLYVYHTTDTSDVLLVTSMVSGESPNPMRYNNVVNKYSDGYVYRTNSSDGSWLVQDFVTGDDIMYFNNASTLVETITQTHVVEYDGTYRFTYVQCDINDIKDVLVYNETDITELSADDYGIQLYNGKPAVIFTSGANTGDTVTITLVIGNTVQVLSERIKFDNIDLTNNTISGLTRGIQGTSGIGDYPVYTMGYGINPLRRLTDAEYNTNWNSFSISSDGDPLQISTTTPALFLQNNDIDR